MSADFQVVSLNETAIHRYRGLSDQVLEALNARWLTVDKSPGYPCRVSLQDAAVGERVLAFNYAHHNVSSAYAATGPIFIREFAHAAHCEKNTLPKMLDHRLLSVRGYNAECNMVVAEVVEGKRAPSLIRQVFQNSSVEYLHIHNAGPGCFNCSVIRS